MDQYILPFGDMLRTFRKRKGKTQQELAAILGRHRNTIGFWERGDILPDTKTKVLELAEALHLNVWETRQLLEASMTTTSPYWYLPWVQNPFFVGREEELAAFHEQLNIDRDRSMKIWAVQGLEGIGKTQFVLEYAYRYSWEYNALFWIEAQTPETLLASFRHIAGVLQLPGRHEANEQHIVEAVYHWLSSHTQWLLIWDHLDDLAILLQYLPPMPQGTVVLTTKNQVLGPVTHKIELQSMTQEEGIRFLLQRTGMLAFVSAGENPSRFRCVLPQWLSECSTLLTRHQGRFASP